MTDKAEPLFPVAAGFVDRHCGIDEKAEREMLAAVGVESLEDLGRRAIPESIFVESAPDIGAPLSEIDALNHLRAFAEANQKGVNMIGMGYYGTRMPSVVIRRVLENPGFYTAYTPYQAEIAQGRLEMLLNFQTMIADLDRPAYRQLLAAGRSDSRRRGDGAFVSRRTRQKQAVFGR